MGQVGRFCGHCGGIGECRPKVVVRGLFSEGCCPRLSEGCTLGLLSIEIEAQYHSIWQIMRWKTTAYPISIEHYFNIFEMIVVIGIHGIYDNRLCCVSKINWLCPA